LVIRGGGQGGHPRWYLFRNVNDHRAAGGRIANVNRIVREIGGSDGAAAVASRIRNHIRIARPDHWIKNVFMIPGAAVALVVAPHVRSSVLATATLALVSACLTASANYTINEYLDGPSDQFHPVKGDRPAALGLLDPRLVMLQYVLLVASGLGAACLVNRLFLFACIALLVMGLIYNVPPLRLKDKAYFDVLTESINSPIRFLLGWLIVTANTLPPSSAILAYWMGGAFLMSVKRYAEYRWIGDPLRAERYRKSFARYTEETLLLSSFFYALCSAFFIAVFLIKYRVEFILTFPLFAILFGWYLAIGFEHNSAAQAPEKLYRETGFLCFAAFTFVVTCLVLLVDLPFLRWLAEPQLIAVRF
jgi:decaprenyl-phosphate phosphoribosyltransferase